MSLLYHRHADISSPEDAMYQITVYHSGGGRSETFTFFSIEEYHEALNKLNKTPKGGTFEIQSVLFYMPN